jgi:primosomal protein N' (replication factor Y)
LIISTRGGTWLPLQDDAEILVVDDLDFAFYESRAPFWNVRDLVLIRASSYAVTFYSHSPSLELLRLSKTGWLSMSSKKRDRVTLFYSNGRLGYQSVIKDGLKSGSVLVLTPERGYVNSIVCAKCRNQYRCKCGGNLIQTKSASKLECALCGKVDKRDKCNFCGSELKLSFKKGIEKTLEELGKQFPGALIQKFNGEFKESNKNSIVISNYSTIPLGDFQAIVALGFERFAYQNQLRATEVARKVISDLIAMQPKAIFMDCESNSYFANFANAPTSIQFAEIELKDRKEVGLPPFSRIALIDCDLKTAQTLEEQDFIKSLEFVNGRAYLKSNIEDGARLSSFLNNLLKYRSLRRLKAWTVKVDPLDL